MVFSMYFGHHVQVACLPNLLLAKYIVQLIFIPNIVRHRDATAVSGVPNVVAAAVKIIKQEDV